jgi:hypothetical protein
MTLAKAGVMNNEKNLSLQALGAVFSGILGSVDILKLFEVVKAILNEPNTMKIIRKTLYGDERSSAEAEQELELQKELDRLSVPQFEFKCNYINPITNQGFTALGSGSYSMSYKNNCRLSVQWVDVMHWNQSPHNGDSIRMTSHPVSEVNELLNSHIKLTDNTIEYTAARNDYLTAKTLRRKEQTQKANQKFNEKRKSARRAAKEAKLLQWYESQGT